MAPVGRQRLRDLFDDSPTPHIAHPPSTHRRDFYIASDGSFAPDSSGLGVIIEGHTGERVARLAVTDDAPDNNTAEYRALHLGLDVLAERAPPQSKVGVLVDHDELAANVNAAMLARERPDNEPVSELSIPMSSRHHWRGIRARLSGFEALRAARIDSRTNPAHPLANAPDQYSHVNRQPDRCLLPDLEETANQVPPPSRADRQATD